MEAQLPGIMNKSGSLAEAIFSHVKDRLARTVPRNWINSVRWFYETVNAGEKSFGLKCNV